MPAVWTAGLRGVLCPRDVRFLTTGESRDGSMPVTSRTCKTRCADRAKLGGSPRAGSKPGQGRPRSRNVLGTGAASGVSLGGRVDFARSRQPGLVVSFVLGRAPCPARHQRMVGPSVRQASVSCPSPNVSSHAVS